MVRSASFVLGSIQCLKNEIWYFYEEGGNLSLAHHLRTCRIERANRFCCGHAWSTMYLFYLPVYLVHCTTNGGTCDEPRGGGHLYFRLDIIRVKGLSKHTLSTYFSGMKIDPKYAFLHAFFLIWASCPFQNLSIWPKTYPFFLILHVFAPLNDIRAYIAWSWKTTLVTWIFFLRGWYPTSDTSGPPPGWRIHFFIFGSCEPLRHPDSIGTVSVR